MAALRTRLAGWQEPFDLCGDYLDGLSSEGTLRAGEAAAERTAAKLKLGRSDSRGQLDVGNGAR
jgi:hypothetical protein